MGILAELCSPDDVDGGVRADRPEPAAGGLVRAVSPVHQRMDLP